METLIDGFFTKHPEHVARILESSSEKVFLEIIKDHPDQLENIISNISPTYMANVFALCKDSEVVEIASKLSDSLCASILRNVKKEKRAPLLSSFEPSRKKILTELISYASNQVGYYIEAVELVLSQNTFIKEAIDNVEKLKNHDYPIYVVDADYIVKGSVDLISLIKHRHDDTSLVNRLIHPVSVSFKASTPFEHIIKHPAWENNQIIPVVGKTNCFLGVISKGILSEDFRASRPHRVEKSHLEEYIYFSEVLWDGLQKLWRS